MVGQFSNSLQFKQERGYSLVAVELRISTGKGIVLSGTGDIIRWPASAALRSSSHFMVGIKDKQSILYYRDSNGVISRYYGIGRLALPTIKTLTTLLGQGIGTIIITNPLLCVYY